MNYVIRDATEQIKTLLQGEYPTAQVYVNHFAEDMSEDYFQVELTDLDLDTETRGKVFFIPSFSIRLVTRSYEMIDSFLAFGSLKLNGTVGTITGIAVNKSEEVNEYYMVDLTIQLDGESYET